MYIAGNNEGLGEIRRKELLQSGMRLGLRKEEDVLVVESQDFPDSMETNWDKSKVAGLLLTAFAPTIKTTSTKECKEIHRPTIDVLITFDSKGVSSHPNHTSLFHGARCFISSLAVPGVDWESPVSLYTLTSISILRKYTFFLDIIASGVGMLFAKIRKNKKAKGPPQNLLFVSGLEQMLCAQDAMISCHQSQMKWFRWGWILLSRYMTINDLRLEKSVGSRKV
ncbi:N-acetylglucosaminyl-phosphatidylinositol de-N-acetylase [Golovinomyces cichoracearum]|uniref:N-acetylglucosaminylphosphatidylinositol deacetylase n=1 Tax=Golovinomyces cichoracearum TaxID=62708 RepID=A0A420IV38_9PEZI|nr:N-acetylglucosaminyl-phosphatidylinositol de-N-acetylase [Golovinomyces cichoracearum]